MNKIVGYFFHCTLPKNISLLFITIIVFETSQLINAQFLSSLRYIYTSNSNSVEDISIVKQVKVYVVNSKADKIAASIILSYCKKNDKILTVNAKIEKNAMDDFNIIKITKVDFDQIGFITLKVGIQGCRKSKSLYCVDCSINGVLILGESARGTLCSLSPTSGLLEADIRFGGEFVNQEKGEFKTTVINGHCK